MKIQFVIATVLGCYLLYGCGSEQQEDVDTQHSRTLSSEIYVKTAPVQVDSQSRMLESMGVIISKVEAKPSFKTGGVIERTYFREGDMVAEGQLLAKLLMTEIQAQVSQAKQGVSKAERDLQRSTNLLADSVATLEQVQNSNTALQVAKEQLVIAEFNQRYSEVRAPIRGKIVRQLLHEGEIAGPGMPVFIILGVDNRDWRVKTGLVDYEWSQVKKGDLASISMDAFPGQQFKAVVSDKAVIGGNASGTLEIELTFKSHPPSLAAGMIGRVHLPLGADTQLTTVPIDALVKSDGNQAIVFTIEQGRAKKVPIRISRIMGDRVVVDSGLEQVKEVVTIGAVYLEEGDFVSIATQ